MVFIERWHVVQTVATCASQTSPQWPLTSWSCTGPRGRTSVTPKPASDADVWGTPVLGVCFVRFPVPDTRSSERVIKLKVMHVIKKKTCLTSTFRVFPCGYAGMGTAAASVATGRYGYGTPGEAAARGNQPPTRDCGGDHDEPPPLGEGEDLFRVQAVPVGDTDKVGTAGRKKKAKPTRHGKHAISVVRPARCIRPCARPTQPLGPHTGRPESTAPQTTNPPVPLPVPLSLLLLMDKKTQTETKSQLSTDPHHPGKQY